MKSADDISAPCDICKRNIYKDTYCETVTSISESDCNADDECEWIGINV